MLRLTMLALTASLCLQPALLHAQEVQHPGYASPRPRPTLRESAIGYQAEVPRRRPRDWLPPAPTLRGWRHDAEAGLRARLHAAELGAASENARREAESGAFRDHGIVGMASGGVGLVGGLWTFLVSAFRGWGCSSVYSCGGSPDGLGVAFGSAFMGLGGLALITGGIVFSQRPSHVEPEAVTLTLGPGSLAITF